MQQFQFHPVIAQWFERKFGSPTAPQAQGWPAIQSGAHTLIAAPTGSGKTLAAFLASLDTLLRLGLDGKLSDETRVVYVSPLKALSDDIHKNLEEPLAEIRDALLTSESGRRMLATARTLIVDEIHALVANRLRAESAAMSEGLTMRENLQQEITCLRLVIDPGVAPPRERRTFLQRREFARVFRSERLKNTCSYSFANPRLRRVHPPWSGPVAIHLLTNGWVRSRNQTVPRQEISMKKVLALSVGVVMAAGVSRAVTINFDDVVGSQVDITTRYSGLGVTLNAIANPYPLSGAFPAPATLPAVLGGVTTWTDGFGSATSPRQVAVAAPTPQTGAAGNGGILISFGFDVNSVSLVGNDLGIGGGTENESVTLTAYDAAGNRIGQVYSTVNLPGSFDQTPATISLSGIRYVAFNYTDSQFGFYAIDDLQFTPGATGVPDVSASLPLFAIGLTSLLGARRWWKTN